MLIGCTICPFKASEDDMVEQDWLFTNNIIKIKIYKSTQNSYDPKRCGTILSCKSIFKIFPTNMSFLIHSRPFKIPLKKWKL